ncbi:hypothetical protein [Phosphitispora fastidiosa]|uniref:hypothetical protein n=1 Tax=Phosphitispora fastidiosa TaxID=2837202 RepID=UPI001E3029EF|nr:hypothetical protein [Phosphitispora fastidiosa]MBU7007738.1 hypothetical protein [Phosphitispora fastidiosa]
MADIFLQDGYNSAGLPLAQLVGRLTSDSSFRNISATLKIFGLRLAQTFLFSSILLKYEKLFVKIKWFNLLTKSGFC